MIGSKRIELENQRYFALLRGRRVPEYVVCERCKGEGEVEARCPSCGGSGEEERECPDCGHHHWCGCSDCDGTKFVDVDCPDCGGDGLSLREASQHRPEPCRYTLPLFREGAA